MSKRLIIGALLAALAVQMAAAGLAEPVEAEEPEEPESQGAVPTDNEEIAGLTGKLAAFSDFCLSSRDHVVRDVKLATNGLASKVFTMFFSSAEQLATTGVDTSREAVDRLSEQMRRPGAPVPLPRNTQPDAIIVEGQQRIQDLQTQPRSLVQAIISALAATKTAVANALLAHLNNIRSNFGPATLLLVLQGACNQVSQYDTDLRQRFEVARAELASRDPELGSVSFESVACVTTRRIVRFDNICKLGRAAQGPVSNILAVSRTPPAI